MIVSFTYLNHCIEINLPDPEDSNIIYISLTKAPGTYDCSQETGYLTDYCYTAQSSDRNQWLTEAVSIAIKGLANRGIKYYDQAPLVLPLATDIDVSDIPF